MILTEKAKEDFEYWFDKYSQQHHHKEWLDNDLYIDEVYLPDTILNSLIIEWLDSVGIYCNAIKYNEYYFQPVCDRIIHDKYPTRQEATKQAIIKANEIYNNR